MYSASSDSPFYAYTGLVPIFYSTPMFPLYARAGLAFFNNISK